MTQILIAGAIAVAVSILLTPVLIRVFSRQGFGQEIRVEGPQSHQTKRGTPSMGGVAILIALWAGYFGAHIVGVFTHDGNGPTASGLLVLGLATALGGVGFLDDFIKIRKHRNLGLNKTAKSIGQFLAAILFGVLVLGFRNDSGYTPASPHLSYVRDIAPLALATVPGFVQYTPPQFNIIISNVPGPKKHLYWNGAQLDGVYPVSIPMEGLALNITVTSTAERGPTTASAKSRCGSFHDRVRPQACQSATMRSASAARTR